MSSHCPVQTDASSSHVAEIVKITGLAMFEQPLREAAAAWERLGGFVVRATERVGAVPDEEVDVADVPADFAAALDDDLNVPAALAAVHEVLRAGNSDYNWNFGVGAKLFLADWVALRADVRDHIFTLDLLGKRSTTQNPELSLGFAFFF